MSALRNPLHISRRIATSEPCVFCSFRSSHVQTTQKRTLAAKPAPSTRQKQWRESSKVLMPAREERQRNEERIQKLLAESAPLTLTASQTISVLGTSPELTLRMKQKVVMFLAYFRARDKQDDKDVEEVMNQFKLSLDDIYEATFLLRNFGQAPQARLGRDLLRACDRLGHEEATLQVVSARLRQDIAQPGVLRATEVLRSLDRLRKLSENGNMRAVFLEGKLAARKGNEELAIKLYEQAMDMILVEEEEAKNNPAEKKQKQKWDRRLDDELSSPWIELGFLYMSRKRTTKALEAYMVGLSQDDPMAYYNLSVLDWHMADGEPSLEWLYNVTKAAASGHFKAAFELGRYYADSPPHPPPEDELLELSTSTKTNEPETPTTGETQPPVPKPAPTFLARLKHFLTTSLLKPSVTIDAKSNIAHHASFAQDAPSRILLAKEWLSLALSYNYLPAAIPLAKLHLQPYIWTSHNLINDINWLSEASLATPGVAKNPLYDVKLAAQTLTAVFGAARTIENARFNAQTSAEFLELAKPWADFGEVLESYEGQVGEVVEEAKEIADAVGVDVMHPEHGLMYKHRGKRGEGVFEYKE